MRVRTKRGQFKLRRNMTVIKRPISSTANYTIIIK